MAWVGILLLLVGFDNITDYNSNFQYVHHIMAMDTIPATGPLIWRSVHNNSIQHAFYIIIIIWELVSGLTIMAGTIRIAKFVKSDRDTFGRAKVLAVVGLVSSMLIWPGAFLTIGGEWFMMGQSSSWNSQNSALRMFLLSGVVLLVLLSAEE